MNILILGGGGREHALAWAVMQNPKCDRLIVAPGNAGIAQIAECPALDILDGPAVAGFCADNAVDLVIIGPEAPLAAVEIFHEIDLLGLWRAHCGVCPFHHGRGRQGACARPWRAARGQG
jgi:phosphoribosylamine-glycine ligase